MRSIMVAGNWKMNCTVAEAHELIRSMLPQLELVSGIEKVVCPPFVALSSVACMLTGTSVALGAQNHYFEDKGAFTGEISPAMLSGLCKFVILGHSERRYILGESSQIVNQKIKAAHKHGLIPIVCVGEKLDENESGQTQAVLQKQLTESLDSIGTEQRLVVAYEPVWAIGTGRAASADQANRTMAMIRTIIGDIFGVGIAEQTTLLYGGSVTSANARELINQPEIDGMLVGGASLKSSEFCQIARAAAESKARH